MVAEIGKGGDQGKRKQARDLLAPVYGWFTEGLIRHLLFLTYNNWRVRRHRRYLFRGSIPYSRLDGQLASRLAGCHVPWMGIQFGSGTLAPKISLVRVGCMRLIAFQPTYWVLS